MRRWIVKTQVDSVQRGGVTTENLAEIKKLKSEVRRVEEDNAELKAATVFLVGKLDPCNR